MTTRIKGHDLDALAASVPLDATAARVTGKGVHFEPLLKPSYDTHIRASKEPLATKPRPRGWNEAAKQTYAELVGHQFGRWRVIGLSALGPGNSGARWVVKCSCGRYEHRSHKAIKRAPTTGDCCAECGYLQHIKHRYDSLGGKPIEAFTKKKPD